MKLPDPASPSALLKLKDILEQAPAEDMVRFLDGIMNVYVVADTVFSMRFPAEYAAWSKEVDDEYK